MANHSFFQSGFSGIEEHRRILELEGVDVVNGTVDLEKYRYTGAWCYVEV